MAAVSHELRTPLTAVVGLAEELAGDAGHGFTPEELAEFHELIAQQSREVAHIVEDPLVAARVEIETVAVDAAIDLGEEAEAVIGAWPAEFGRVRRGELRAKAMADPARVRQILRNLLTNAIRYGGPVVVETSEEGSRSLLRVRDDGAGIPEEERGRIFGPYQRGSSDRRGRPGSVGLGLYVSCQLAQLMGGDLTYRYEGGESVFELELPAG